MFPTDFTLSYHGSIALLAPLTPEAQALLASDAMPDDAMFWGDALVVELRYVDGLIEALFEDGYTTERPMVF